MKIYEKYTILLSANTISSFLKIIYEQHKMVVPPRVPATSPLLSADNVNQHGFSLLLFFNNIRATQKIINKRLKNHVAKVRIVKIITTNRREKQSNSINWKLFNSKSSKTRRFYTATRISYLNHAKKKKIKKKSCFTRILSWINS